MENIRKSSGIAAILFDLDNTLIQTRKADKLACNKLAQILWEKYAVPVDFASNACKTFLRTFRKCPENVSMSLDNWRHLLWMQALGAQYNKYAVEIYHIWLKLRYDYLQLTPEIYNLLKKLRQHYFVGLITNGTSCAQWEKIEKLKLQPLFDVILVSGDLPWEKPNQKIFHEACDLLGVEPQQCIMVGDKLETDILGGVKANLGGTVWMPLSTQTDYNTTLVSPDYIINDVLELLNLLPKNPKGRTPRCTNRKKISIPDYYDTNSNSSDGS